MYTESLACDRQYQPIHYENGIKIVDKFGGYDSERESVRVVTGWEVADEAQLDEYNVSIQIITPDWQKVGQAPDRHLHDDVLKWYAAEISTAGLSAGTYHVVVILYDRRQQGEGRGRRSVNGRNRQYPSNSAIQRPTLARTMLPFISLPQKDKCQDDSRRTTWRAMLARGKTRIHTTLAAMTLVLLVAFALGAKGLNADIVWLDEMFSLGNMGAFNPPYSPPDVVNSLRTYSPDHVPLYFVLGLAVGAARWLDAAASAIPFPAIRRAAHSGSYSDSPLKSWASGRLSWLPSC